MGLLNESPFERVQIVVNLVTHVFIGFVAIYMTWFCINQRLTFIPLHAWLGVLGILLAEGILSIYSGNVLTNVYSHGTNRHIHWILQVAGSAVALGGAFLMINHVNEEGGAHFDSTHGKLGLASVIFLFLNLLTGIFSFFAARTQNIAKPVILKTLHIFLGLTGFTLGMVTLHFGIMKLDRFLDPSFVIMLAVISLVSLVLTLLGPLKSITQNVITFCTE